MTRFNQALIAGASSIALFAGALTLIAPVTETWGYSTNDLGYTTGYSSVGGSFGEQPMTSVIPPSTAPTAVATASLALAPAIPSATPPAIPGDRDDQPTHCLLIPCLAF